DHGRDEEGAQAQDQAGGGGRDAELSFRGARGREGVLRVGESGMMFAFLEEKRFESLRRRMVEEQLAGQGIRDERVPESFRRVPRHVFVPEELVDQAYQNHPVAIGQGQTISQPYMVACMTEALALRG